MSGFHTHMLIGAVGGLVVFKIAERLAPTVLTVRLGDYAVPDTAIGLGFIGASAYLALWPDIDEPGTHVSRQAPRYMWLFAAILTLTIAVAASLPLVWLAVAVILGAVVGRVAGGLILVVLRFLSGGHRRLTHSLLFGLVLWVLAGVAYKLGFGLLALPLVALAWGQLLHLIGDVVTPGGIPLFYPLWWGDIHLFPHEFTRFGEPIIAGLTVLLGLVFILL